MTSLQQQLAVIAANSTKQLDAKSQRSAHSKSLLFDAKIAASQNFNVLHQICREGFDDLCALDSRFEQFANTLFSEQSKEEEREQMTAAENAELDIAIHAFLDLVASKLLLKPGLKALEWLVRRFRVHEYNSEHLILVFLPFHATPIFLALLAILPARLPAAHKFLRPYASASSNPPIHAIVYAATHTPAFFVAFNRQVISSSQDGFASTELVRFWTLVVSQAVDGMITAAQSGIVSINKERTESVLLQILPVLDDVFQLSNAPDMEIAACMIITILAARGNLSDHVKARFMEALASTWSNDTVDARLVCLVALCQDAVPSKLSKKVAKKLVSTSDLVSRLSIISSSYRASNLVTAICRYCISRLDRGFSREFDILGEVLGHGLLRSGALVDVVRILAAKIASLSPEQNAALRLQTIGAQRLQSFFKSESFATISQRVESSDTSWTALESLFSVRLPMVADAPDAMEVDEALSVPPNPASQLQEEAIKSLRAADSSFLAVYDHEVLSKLASPSMSTTSASSFVKHLGESTMTGGKSGIEDMPFITLSLRLIFSPQWLTSIRLQVFALLQVQVIRLLAAHFDIQMILPYLLVLLQDESIHVRKASLNLLKQLSEHQISKSTWGRAIYGKVDDIDDVLLSSEQISVLLDNVILARSVELLSDATLLPRAITSFMKTKLSSQKKLKASISIFIAWHASHTCLCHAKVHLLELLHQFGKPALAARSTYGLQALEQWTLLDADRAAAICLQQGIELSLVNTAVLTSILPNEQKGMTLLQSLLSASREDLLTPSHARLSAIWSQLDQQYRQTILTQLVDLSLQDVRDARAIRDASNATLRTLPLTARDLVSLLELPSLVAKISPTKVPSGLRSKVASSHKAGDLSSDMIALLRRYTRVLEVVESASLSGAENETSLLSRLFSILAELQSTGMNADSSLVYLKTLTINALSTAVNAAQATNVKIEQSSSLRVDVLVDSIGSTSNIQYQQSCLLLIAQLASLSPEVVLHSVMPIFTLMSSTILRQADDFSAHVVQQTIAQVVPPLMQSLRMKEKDVTTGSADIINSFAAAFEHVPFHRRLDIYTQVVNALGINDALFVMISLLRLRYPTDMSAKNMIVHMVASFGAETILTTISRTLDLIADIFSAQQNLAEPLLHVRDLNASDRATKADVLLQLLISLASDNSITSKIVQSMQPETESAAAQQLAFSKLMGATVPLVERLQVFDCGRTAKTMLGAIFGLLPLEDLVTCAQLLLDGASSHVRALVIYAMTKKLKGVKQVGASEAEALTTFVPILEVMLTTPSNDEEQSHVLACFLQIAHKVGRASPDALTIFVNGLLGQQCLGSSSRSRQDQCLSTIAELVPLLADHMLPQIPSVLQQSLSLLEREIHGVEHADYDLQSRIFAVLAVIAQIVPFGMTGQYLQKTIELTQLSIDKRSGPFVTRDKLYQALVQHISATDLIPALSIGYAAVAQTQGFDAIAEYYKLVRSVITKQSKAVVLKQSTVLLNFLQQGLFLRATSSLEGHQSRLSAAGLEDLELLIIDIAISTVLKLNDAVFRPFFIRLVDEATFKSKQPTGQQLAKAISLFNFTRALLHRLGGLVQSFVSYTTDLASHVLVLSASGTINSNDLLLATMGALRQSFVADTDEYWQAPARFTSIKAPVVSLLAQPNLQEMSAQIISTITAFAAASGSTDHFKAINSEILPLFRAANSSTRLTAVQCQRSLTDELGEDWLVLLPEMLPLITELLEDDDEKVERETRLWIKNIEVMVGENLDSMLQ